MSGALSLLFDCFFLFHEGDKSKDQWVVPPINQRGVSTKAETSPNTSMGICTSHICLILPPFQPPLQPKAKLSPRWLLSWLLLLLQPCIFQHDNSQPVWLSHTVLVPAAELHPGDCATKFQVGSEQLLLAQSQRTAVPCDPKSCAFPGHGWAMVGVVSSYWISYWFALFILDLLGSIEHWAGLSFHCHIRGTKR